MRSLTRAIFLFVLILALSCPAWCGDITIYHDRFGTPIIVADTYPDAVYGLGYATAQNNAERMGLNFKQARGRLAEVLGKGQLLTDGFVRGLGFEEVARKKADVLSGELAVLINAFCEGANKSIAEQKGKIPAWIGPVTPTDVLALGQLVNASMALEAIAGQLLPSTGSNQFAVAAARSANHHAILSADPHLLWDGILAWQEFGIHTKDFQFHGVTLPGLPLGVMGHTDHVAWSMTNNDPALYNFYTVKTNPDNPKQYSYHGEWRDYDNVSVEMRYLEDGEMKVRTQTIKKTAWGPMVPFSAQSVGLTMLGDWNLFDEGLAMARAKNAKQFREALKSRGIAMWNIVYADTQGHIGYQYNAHIPKRDPAFNWRRPVAGDDPRTKWGPLWNLDDLPHAENPKSNLLVNCNSSPWLTPLGDEIKSSGWPADVTTYGPTTRYDRLSSILKEDNSITVEEAKRYATDTRVPYALAVKREFKSAAKEAAVAEALQVLAAWDGSSNVDAKGCGLYAYWHFTDKGMMTLARKAERGETWTAPELETALAALGKAAIQMKADHGRLDIPWGEMHVSHRGSKTVPVAGYGYLTRGDSAAAVMPTFGAFKGGAINCVGGSSVRMVVDLDPKGVRSWSILPYGDSNNPASPHYGDQMEMYGRGEYKETLFGLEAITKRSVDKVVLKR
jgi:acyl-homoserine-lactone acylase